MQNKKILLYMHGGSGNHGCEAIVRTLHSLIGGSITVFSGAPDEDSKYILDHPGVSFVECGRVPPVTTWDGFWVRVGMKLFRQKNAYIKAAYKPLFKAANQNAVAFSIGGDNYCYDGMPAVLAAINKRLKRKGAVTVLYGCSIEPSLLKDQAVIEDLARYDCIVARESITYNALCAANISTKIYLLTDSAFTLPTGTSFDEKTWIDSKKDYVGINLSPLVLENTSAVLFQAYSRVIEYILKSTEMDVLLIPHVVWNGNDDRLPLKRLYELFSHSKRVHLISDRSAVSLKGIISRCRFFIGARTHATIAAYSNCIPTIVVGYSVKSRGIARDLFGTEENYVCSIDEIKQDSDMLDSFLWVMKNEKNIRRILEQNIPNYVSKAFIPEEIMQKLGL